MTDSIEARVARGAALLDEHHPDWWRQVDLGNLDLGSEDACVLGQLFGTYTCGRDYLGLLDRLPMNWPDREYGFVALLMEPEHAAEEAWVAVIKDRWERLA